MVALPACRPAGASVARWQVCTATGHLVCVRRRCLLPAPAHVPAWSPTPPRRACCDAGWTFEAADSGRFRNSLGDALLTYRQHRDSFTCAPVFEGASVGSLEDTPACRGGGRQPSGPSPVPARPHCAPVPAPPPPSFTPHRALQLRGMQQDLSWEHAAENYEDVLVQAKFQASPVVRCAPVTSSGLAAPFSTLSASWDPVFLARGPPSCGTLCAAAARLKGRRVWLAGFRLACPLPRCPCPPSAVVAVVTLPRCHVGVDGSWLPPHPAQLGCHVS